MNGMAKRGLPKCSGVDVRMSCYSFSFFRILPGQICQIST